MSEWSEKHCHPSRPSGPDTRIKAVVGALGTVDHSAIVYARAAARPRRRFQRDVIGADTLREMLARLRATSGEPS
jgi:hypothetical protein